MWVGNEYQFTPHGLLGQNPPVLNPPVLPMPVVDAPQSLLPTAPQNPQVFGGQNDGGGGSGGPDTASGKMDIGGFGGDYGSTGALGFAGDLMSGAGTLTGSTPLGIMGFGASAVSDYNNALDVKPDYDMSVKDFFGGLLSNTMVGGLLGLRNWTDRAHDLNARSTDASGRINTTEKSKRATAQKHAAEIIDRFNQRQKAAAQPTGGVMGGHPADKDPSGNGGNKNGGGGSKGAGGNVQGGGGPAGGAPGDRSREGGFR